VPALLREGEEVRVLERLAASGDCLLLDCIEQLSADFRLWHIPEVVPAASDGRSQFNSGLRQAVQQYAGEFRPWR